MCSAVAAALDFELVGVLTQRAELGLTVAAGLLDLFVGFLKLFVGGVQPCLDLGHGCAELRNGLVGGRSGGPGVGLGIQGEGVLVFEVADTSQRRSRSPMASSRAASRGVHLVLERDDTVVRDPRALVGGDTGRFGHVDRPLALVEFGGELGGLRGEILDLLHLTNEFAAGAVALQLGDGEGVLEFADPFLGLGRLALCGVDALQQFGFPDVGTGDPLGQFRDRGQRLGEFGGGSLVSQRCLLDVGFQ